MSLRAVLFDVGGTLLSEDTYLIGEAWDARRVARLREAFGADRAWFAEVVRLPEDDGHEGVPHRQATRAAIGAFLAARGVKVSEEEVERVRAACCVPSTEAERPREGALEALRWCRAHGLKVALVTNVLWRSAADSLVDWTQRGVADCIDAIVTSLDVGWRKPHSAMFERALGDVAVRAEQAVMVGNSPDADIAPAKRLGMRAVLVRSRNAGGAVVRPDAIIDEPRDLPAVLRSWL